MRRWMIEKVHMDGTCETLYLSGIYMPQFDTKAQARAWCRMFAPALNLQLRIKRNPLLK